MNLVEKINQALSLGKQAQTNIEELKNSQAFPYSNYSLPILYLTGDTTGISKDNAVDLTYTYEDKTGSCTLKWQGSSSLSYPKKNFTIKFCW